MWKPTCLAKRILCGMSEFLTSNKEFFKNENSRNSIEEIADRINQDAVDKKARILRQRSQ